MSLLSRLSFRQLLLAAFLLIAALLGGTSVHALLTLEKLATHSRETAHEAVRLTFNTQRLAERAVAMERSARQFLVLNDPAFRERYLSAWKDARDALAALSSALPDASADLEEWENQSKAAWSILEMNKARRQSMQSAMDEALSRLAPINARLEAESKRERMRRNQALLEELETQRTILTGQFLVSITLAALLSFAFGVWLSRPVSKIEQAISLLGESRFEEPLDVSGPEDLRKLGRQLDWLRQRLATLEADKARFLRHVSHELKTPLAALREGIALLQDEVAGALSDSQREITRILKQNAFALQNQIEDLLRYNAASFGAQHLHRQPIRPSALVAETVDIQRLQWQSRGLQLEVQGQARIIEGDREKLGVAIGNLLSNAIRFSPDGGTIRFMLGEEAGRLLLDCIDEGPGVAPADAARVFEPFYQGERQPAGARRGSGIGLSIVKEYVEAHGGTIHLLPNEDGAHFRIELPYEN